MDDQGVLSHIEALVKEEHDLQSREAADAQDEQALAADRARLEAVRIDLDRCWDLLRQRRAARSSGHDPDDARERDASVVEHYLQ